MRQFISLLLLCSLVATVLAQTNTAAPTIEEVESQIKQAEQAQANRASEAARKAELAKQEAIKRDANAASARMATLLFRSDAECTLSINGEAQGVLAAGATKAVKVNPGDQIVDCVSVELAEVAVNTVKTAAAGTQSAVVLAFADKISSARTKAEQAAQKLAATSQLPSVDAQVLTKVPIRYPPALMRRGVEGATVIRVLVSSIGEAQKFEIDMSSGHKEMDEAAIRAVENYRFTPAMKNGVPTMGWVRTTVTFSMAN